MSRDWETKIRWNVKLFYLINGKRSQFLDRFYKYFFYMGKSYSLPIYIALFFIFNLKSKPILHLTISLILTGILMPILKYTFKHKRPYSLLDNVNLLEPVSLKSFPSADSAYVFTIFSVCIFYNEPVLSSLLFLISIIIGYGRVYMGAHFPLDVFVGYLSGFLSAVAGFYIMGLVL